MTRSAILLAVLAAGPALCADFNARAAAAYLDGRQQQWAAWQPATATGVPCLSCHSSVPYLLARPALRRKLGESKPTEWEAGLLAGVRSRASRSDTAAFFVGEKSPQRTEQLLGTQVILAALMLARDDAARGGTLSAEARQALDRMWKLQVRTGPDAGAWKWTAVELDPWEEEDSAFYGAALAAMATGTAPAGYAAEPEIRSHVESLRSYLRGAQARQPLHNRLLLLWASTEWRGLVTDAERREIAEAAFAAQSADGGWTIQSLGPWRPHPKAPAAQGSSAYATGLTAYSLLRAGWPSDDRHLRSALAWLQAQQSRESGYWDGVSMNKRYPEGSMPTLFMRDAATAFASLALLEADSAQRSARR